MHPVLFAILLILAVILDIVALRFFLNYTRRRMSSSSDPKQRKPRSRTGEIGPRLAGHTQRWVDRVRQSLGSILPKLTPNTQDQRRSSRIKYRIKLDSSAVIEIGLLTLWALWVGRNFLNFNPELWPNGTDFPLNIETHFIWDNFKECGTCFFWNGFLNGGHPAFSDLLAPILHPVVVFATLLAGAINGAKITLLVSLIMAGIAQWWIARTLGLGRLARLWSGGMAIVGGHLAGRMEMGLFGVTLANASLSLALAASLALGIHKRKIDAVWLGITLGFGILAGQGYTQIGFFLFVAPALLFFLLEDGVKINPVWKDFVLAGFISILIAGVLLVPMLHFLPHFGKEIDTAHRSTQPIEYGVLNLVIRDLSYFQNESLGKVLLPSVYINYIGWVPLLLAALAFRFYSRDQWRRFLFFSVSIVLLLIGSSDLLVNAAAKWLPSIIDRFRYPPLMAGLLVPLVIGLASIGLDHLTAISWPRLSLETEDGKKVQLPLSKVIVLIPLVVSLLNAYSFGQTFLVTTHVPQDVQRFGQELREAGTQWVEPPKNSFVWVPPLLESGQKITGVYRPAHWKYRDPPTGSIQAFLQGEQLPDGEILGQFETVQVVRLPTVHYAFVKLTSNEIVPCEANSIGGNISVHCSSDSPGQLFVEENSWNGWKAYVDGERVSLRKNRWLSVYAPAGDHHYEFRYRPIDVWLGLGLTICGFLLSGWIYLSQRPAYREAISEAASKKKREIEAADKAEETGADEDGSISPAKIDEPVSGEQEASTEQVVTSEEIPGGDKTDRQRSKFESRISNLLLIVLNALKTLLKRVRKLDAGGIFLVSCLAYLIIRVIGLTDFPIYFFTDEAVQTVLAADLVRDGFHGYDGVLLPTYFENAWFFNLSLSVYLQVLPTILFGKSIFVTRAVSVLVGFTGAVAVGLTLKDSFRSKYWWAGILVLSAVPAWFLHSRTAFETVIFTAMMAWTLYFYLRYRDGQPGKLYAAIIFGALAFYSYRGGQIIVLAFAAVLFLVDIRYHLKYKKSLLIGLGLVVLLTIPYIRFQVIHGEEAYFQLRMLDTYWLQDISLREKLLRFGQIYLQGLDPRFWFTPGSRDLNRHIMNGHGHISPFLAPFLLIGLGLGIAKFKQKEYRTTLILALLSPLGAALVGVGITRILVFVIPVAILSTLGMVFILEKLERRASINTLAWLLFSLLLLFNSYLLWDSIINGPTWYQDYGIGGMQYGAQQVFGKAEELLDEDPGRTVYISSTWANGTDILMRFFIPDGSPAFIGNADGFLNQEMPLDDDTIFILTAEEFQRLSESPKIANIEVMDTIEYPDDRTGFFVTRFDYSPEAARLFVEEQAERTIPRQGDIIWEDQRLEIRYPYLDMGELRHMFDNDLFTLARVYSDNPAVFTIDFEKPTSLDGIRVTTGSMDMQVTTYVHTQNSPDPLHFEEQFNDLPDDPTVSLMFGETIEGVLEIRIEILSLIEGDPFKIHIRELGFIEPTF
jgi:hypothetical protein